MDLLDDKIIVITNVGGNTKHSPKGIILLARNKTNTAEEPIRPPQDSEIGDRVFLEGCDIDE